MTDGMRLELLHSYYRYLFGRGEVRSRKELAARTGVAYHTVNQAFHGGRYLTDKLLRRIVAAFPSLQAEGWEKDGMVAVPVSLLDAMQDTIAKLARKEDTR